MPGEQFLNSFIFFVISQGGGGTWKRAFLGSALGFCLEWGGCCMKQLGVYKEWGQEHGISPQEYYEEVINFTSDNRKVNLISVSKQRESSKKFEQPK